MKKYKCSPINYFLFAQTQETNESTLVEHQETQPEEDNKQGENVPIVDSAATREQASNPSLNEEEVEETGTATTTEEVKLHNLFL